MKKLLPWIVALGLIGGVVYAQQVTLPPPNGGSLLACAYTGNTSPTIVSGNFGWVQCDVHGQVLISNPGSGGGGGGGTTSNVSASAGAGFFLDGWDVTQGTKVDAAYTSGSGSVVSILKGIYTSVNAAIPDCGATPCTNKIGNVYTQSQFPPAAVPIQNSTTSSAGTITNLSADASNFNYICGFSIRANATAAATGNSTVSGLTTTLNFLQWTAPLASGVGVNEQLFQPCQPSSAVNTAIAISPAFPGAGGTVTVSVWGFKKTTSP